MNSGAGKAERQGQTTEQIEQLDKCISILSDSVEQLTDRLSRTLRNSPGLGLGGEDKPEDELVPMANSIRQLKQRVGITNKEVQDILSRLEL